MKVFFGSDVSVRGYIDKGFGVRVEWDTPLLDGYNYEFLPLMKGALNKNLIGSAGPLNYGGVHPNITCTTPQPSN